MRNINLTKPEYILKRELLDKDIPFIEKEKFSKFIRRRVPLFMDGYRYAGYAMTQRWGVHFCFFEAGHEQVKPCYISDTMNVKGAEVWLKKMNENPTFTQSLIDEVKGIVVLEKNFANSILQRELSTKETIHYLKGHLDYWVDFFEVAYLWFSVENIKQKIDKEIEESWEGTDDELEYFFENAYRPMALPLSSVEQRDLLKLSLLKGEELEVALKDHCEKYKHLSLHNPDDEYFDLEYYRGRVKPLEDPIEYQKQKDLLESADLEISEAVTLLSKADISDLLKQRVEFVRWFMYLRTECIDHMMLVNSAFKSVMSSLVKKLDLTVEAVLHMTYEEIISSLELGKLSIGKDLVVERLNNGYAYLIAPNGSYLVTGEDVDTLHQLVIPKVEEEKITEIKGQSAFKGKVTGIARVILDRRQSKDLQEGEILVTTMTSPEFVPAMKIAGGIVTNEGGILCHAAIMSRELRKPCIIGTKIATDAIKTGQKITLDADKGIITID